MTSTTKRPWLYLLLAVLAGLTMLFAACGGGDDDDDDDSNDATATASSDAGDDGGDDEETDEPTEEPTDDSGDDGGDDTGDEFDDLLNLAGDLEAATGKVTYETTDTDAGDDVTTTMTVYSDPDNNRSRWDSVDETGSTVTIITTTEASYTCTAEAGEEGACFKGEGSDDASGLGLLGFFASPAIIGAYIEGLDNDNIDFNRSTDEIAGTDASCFEWSGEIDGESGSGKMCFAENGILLSADFDDNAGTITHMIATDFSDSVSDSDFEPPYDTLEIPGQ